MKLGISKKTKKNHLSGTNIRNLNSNQNYSLQSTFRIIRIIFFQMRNNKFVECFRALTAEGN